MARTPDGGAVVAIVPAFDNEHSIAETVEALHQVPAVDRVLVIDDGSSDSTAAAAVAAGAEVFRHGSNRGKAAAVTTGLGLVSADDVVLLVDADTRSSAAEVARLLGPVLADEADLVIGTLPAAGARAGFGTVVRRARSLLERVTGRRFEAPLSGQRAARAGALKGLTFAPRFGLEVSMTAGVHRAGGRIVEMPVAIEHDHTGRSLRGFRHRGRQGLDVLRTAWLLRTSVASRAAIAVGLTVLATVAMIGASLGYQPGGERIEPAFDRVIVFSMPTVTLDDVDRLGLETFSQIYESGALAANSVRTAATRPVLAEAFATLSAGARVPVTSDAVLALERNEFAQGGTAAELASRNAGQPVDGEVVVPLVARLRTQADAKDLSSAPGALADALHARGLRTAAIGNADYVDGFGNEVRFRPVALAATDSTGSVDEGAVSSELLMRDAAAPFGRRADNSVLMKVYDDLSDDVAFVAIDSGDLVRTALAAPDAAPDAVARQRTAALRSTDELLGEVVDRLDDRDLLVVTSLVPPGRDARLLPVVLYSPSLPAGSAHSPATRRPSVVTLTDLTVTAISAVGAEPAPGQVGSVLRVEEGEKHLGEIQRIDRRTQVRNATVGSLARTYAFGQIGLYLVAALALGRFAAKGRAMSVLYTLLLAVAAYPLATFALSFVPIGLIAGEAAYVVGFVLLLAAITLAVRRSTRSALDAFRVLCGLTFAFLLFDVATGGRAQWAGLLTAPPTNAGRFFGFGNPAYAIIATSVVMWGALHVRRTGRRADVLAVVGGAFVLVTIADGAPMLGADVGGLITLFPILLVTWWLLAGKRLPLRYLVGAVVATVALVALATVVDLARPAEQKSHLAQFVNDIRSDGIGVFTTTVTRKLKANLLSYGSPWVWSLPIMLAYVLQMLLRQAGFERLLPVRSPERAGAIGALAVGVIGYAANDSGVVVTALVAVYVGPYLTFLAGEHALEGPVAAAGPQSVPA